MNIEFKDLSVSLDGKEILHKVNLKIDTKELVVILGLNGAGKTTLLKTLVGVNEDYSGKLLIDDIELKRIKINDRAKMISYCPQHNDFTSRYTVLEFVLMGLAPHIGIFKSPKASDISKAVEALEKMNILKLKNKYMDSISGGERQLVYLARSIVQSSGTMVLDEPCSHLDFDRQNELMKRLKNLADKKENLIIVTLHDPNLALKFADRIVLIHNKTVFDVISKDEDNYQEHFINSINKMYSNKLRLIDCKTSYMVALD